MMKKILVPVFGVVLTSGALFMTAPAFAQTTTPTPVHTNFFQGLVDFIAQKFGLDKTQVQSAITDYHKQQMQDHKKKRLDKLVQEGKITSAQEQAIITELASLKSKYNPDALKTMTPDQRKTQKDAIKKELTDWANGQGIDVTYVLPMLGMRGGFGKGMGKPNGHFKQWGANPSGTPSATPTPIQSEPTP